MISDGTPSITLSVAERPRTPQRSNSTNMPSPRLVFHIKPVFKDENLSLFTHFKPVYIISSAKHQIKYFQDFNCKILLYVQFWHDIKLFIPWYFGQTAHTKSIISKIMYIVLFLLLRFATVHEIILLNRIVACFFRLLCTYWDEMECVANK